MIKPIEYFTGTLWNESCITTMTRMPENSVDLVVTDPPYGINFISGKQKSNTRNNGKSNKRIANYFGKIIGDRSFNANFVLGVHRILKPNGAFYCFISWKHWNALCTVVEQCNMNIKNMIVLNKSNHGQGDIKGTYAPKHELVLFASKGRHLLCWPKRLNDVIDVKVLYSGSVRNHPMEKRIDWITPFILASSKKNDIVFDGFAGSGSVLISAERLKRRWIGCEISANYCNVTEARIRKEFNAQDQTTIY